MKKEARIDILFFGLIIFIIVLSFYPFINSMQILPSLNVSINAGNSNYSVSGGATPLYITINEDTQYNFNFTINNSADGGPENLTDVNITVPDEFAFVSNSNRSYLNATGTTSHYNQVYFSNLTVANQHHILSWNGTNLTSSVNMNAANASCCNISNVVLAVNFSVATPGNYNITITYQFNNSATSNRTNVSIIVNDSTKPDTVKIWPTGTFDLNRSGENVSGSIVLNVSVLDNGNITGLNKQRDITHLFFNITNSSGSQNGTFIASNVTGVKWNEVFWNVSLDTTKFPDGQYNITIWANDSYNNLNNSKIITNVTIDNTNPTGSVSCTPATLNSGNTVTCTCSPSDVRSGINTSATTITANPSTANTGTFTETCTFKDRAGNSGTASGTYTVEQGGTGSGGGGGGGSSSSGFYSKTIPKTGDLKETKTITQVLDDKERVKISVNNEIHYVGVREVKTNSAVIEIESDPVRVELSVGQSTKVDVDNDKVYDVYVKLDSISNGKAFLTIEYLSEAIPAEEKTTEVEEKEEKVKSGALDKVEKKKSKILLWVLLVVLLVVIVFVLKKKYDENYRLKKYKKSIKYLSL